MARVTAPPIAPLPADATETERQLQRTIIVALQRLTDQLNNQSEAGDSTLEMKGYRITNLGDPAAQRDAVNKKYVDDAVKHVSAAPVTITAGTSTSTTVSTTKIAY